MSNIDISNYEPVFKLINSLDKKILDKAFSDLADEIFSSFYKTPDEEKYKGDSYLKRIQHIFDKYPRLSYMTNKDLSFFKKTGKSIQRRLWANKLLGDFKCNYLYWQSYYESAKTIEEKTHLPATFVFLCYCNRSNRPDCKLGFKDSGYFLLGDIKAYKESVENRCKTAIKNCCVGNYYVKKYGVNHYGYIQFPQAIPCRDHQPPVVWRIYRICIVDWFLRKAGSYLSPEDAKSFYSDEKVQFLLSQPEEKLMYADKYASLFREETYLV